jgi:hypothetical protein
VKSDSISFQGKDYAKVHLIHGGDPTAGFSALITYALNGARRARLNNWLPVVDYSRENAPHFYDADYGNNVWEYYFEPVAGLGSSQLRQWLDSGKLGADQVHRYTDEQVVDWHVNDPDRITTFWGPVEVEDRQAWMAEKRQLGREYVGNYVRVKPHIREKLESLQRDLFRFDYMFGVHIRGTDFSYARPTTAEEYFAALDEKIEAVGVANFGIFLATDQKQFVDRFEARFPGRIVTIDVARSSNEVVPFRLKNVDPYKKGEDPLLDILLLSRCDYLFKSVSAVGEYALWFNPSLECTDFALGNDYRHLKSSNYWTGVYLLADLDNKGPLRVRLLSWWRIARQMVENFHSRVMRKLRRLRGDSL